MRLRRPASSNEGGWDIRSPLIQMTYRHRLTAVVDGIHLYLYPLTWFLSRTPQAFNSKAQAT